MQLTSSLPVRRKERIPKSKLFNRSEERNPLRLSDASTAQSEQSKSNRPDSGFSIPVCTPFSTTALTGRASNAVLFLFTFLSAEVAPLARREETHSVLC